MTEELKNLFHRTRPQADPDARARALAAARTAFEQENSASLQELATPERPTISRRFRLFILELGREVMTLTRPLGGPLLVGSVSAVAIAAALIFVDGDRIPFGHIVLSEAEEPDRDTVGPIALNQPKPVAAEQPLTRATRLSAQLAQGMRAYTLRINSPSGVAGFIGPGDRVDVILTRQIDGNIVSGVIIQDLPVIAVDQNLDQETNRPRLGSTATVEVDSRQAQKLTLAQQVGSLTLTLRGANETSTAKIDPVDLGDIDFRTDKPTVAMRNFGTTVRVRRGTSLGTQRIEDSPEELQQKRAQLEAEFQKLQRAESDATVAVAPPPSAAAAPEVRRGTTLDGSGLMPAVGIAPEPIPPQGYRDQGRDKFAEVDTNPPKVTAEEPVSTFSIDVDTASYSFVRKSLMQGVLPQPNAVRVEEMINYFPYDYAPPADRETPFATHVEIMPTPWNKQTRLMRIGIKGYEIPQAERPQANLVFLIDSSGSMNAPDKLPLLLNSFRLLLGELDGDDTVSIVTYAGSAGIVLEPTPASNRGAILAALQRLHAGGSTAGAEGIRQAYQLAESAFVEGGVNRVILATDGDFNVGITNIEELKGFVERKRRSGVMLSVLGFGQGNYNDHLMQTLAQNGNGSAAYIDTLNEARKALVEEAGSTLFTIAKDVKIQIEFNPATVAEYRLIGYETRMLAREDFNNDRVDAGEIGSGHSVTALYELTPVGSDARLVEDLRYGQPAAEDAEAEPETAAVATEGTHGNEYGFLKIRYKAPDGDVSKLIETPITTSLETDDPAAETRFAASVAAFGQLLRGGEYTGAFDFDDVLALAQGAKGDDPYGYRAEFLNLVRMAGSAAGLEPLRQ